MESSFVGGMVGLPRSARLMAGIESREEEFTMLDRTTLEKSLVLADEAQGPGP